MNYYLAKGVTFCNDTWQDRELIEKIPKYVKKYAECPEQRHLHRHSEYHTEVDTVRYGEHRPTATAADEGESVECFARAEDDLTSGLPTPRRCGVDLPDGPCGVGRVHIGFGLRYGFPSRLSVSHA